MWKYLENSVYVTIFLKKTTKNVRKNLAYILKVFYEILKEFWGNVKSILKELSKLWENFEILLLYEILVQFWWY